MKLSLAERSVMQRVGTAMVLDGDFPGSGALRWGSAGVALGESVGLLLLVNSFGLGLFTALLLSLSWKGLTPSLFSFLRCSYRKRGLKRPREGSPTSISLRK